MSIRKSNDLTYFEKLYNRDTTQKYFAPYAQCLMTEGKPSDAIEHLLNGLLWNSSYNNARVLLGKAYIETGRPSDAVMQLSEAIEIDQYNTQAWFLLGEAHTLLEDMPEAYRSYSQAYELSPENYKLETLVDELKEFEANPDATESAPVDSSDLEDINNDIVDSFEELLEETTPLGEIEALDDGGFDNNTDNLTENVDENDNTYDNPDIGKVEIGEDGLSYDNSNIDDMSEDTLNEVLDGLDLSGYESLDGSGNVELPSTTEDTDISMEIDTVGDTGIEIDNANELSEVNVDDILMSIDDDVSATPEDYPNLQDSEQSNLQKTTQDKDRTQSSFSLVEPVAKVVRAILSLFQKRKMKGSTTEATLDTKLPVPVDSIESIEDISFNLDILPTQEDDDSTTSDAIDEDLEVLNSLNELSDDMDVVDSGIEGVENVLSDSIIEGVENVLSDSIIEDVENVLSDSIIEGVENVLSDSIEDSIHLEPPTPEENLDNHFKSLDGEAAPIHKLTIDDIDDIEDIEDIEDIDDIDDIEDIEDIDDIDDRDDFIISLESDLGVSIEPDPILQSIDETPDSSETSSDTVIDTNDFLISLESNLDIPGSDTNDNEIDAPPAIDPNAELKIEDFIFDMTSGTPDNDSTVSMDSMTSDNNPFGDPKIQSRTEGSIFQEIQAEAILNNDNTRSQGNITRPSEHVTENLNSYRLNDIEATLMDMFNQNTEEVDDDDDIYIM